MGDFDRYQMERTLGWLDLTNKIPFLRLPEGYEFAAIPPFGGAAARLLVRKIGGAETTSVYLDTDNSLGYYCAEDGTPKPYWEVYPVDDNVARCDMADGEELLRLIVRSLAALEPRHDAG